MAILDEIKASFKSGSNLVKLIYINLAVFLLVNILDILFFLFNAQGKYTEFLMWFAVPADLSSLAKKPWTIISYMFLHKSFMHILFNLLWLYWFGRIFLEYLDGRKLVGIYLLGGISGAVLYIIVYNLFPVFGSQLPLSHALGASASVMAIIVATAAYVPDYSMNLLFIGRVKIIYVALAGFLATSIFDFSINSGGKIAHIGGALFGYFYIMQYRKGIDISKGLNNILDRIFSMFKPRSRIKVTHKKSESEYDYRNRKAQEQKEIDRILDKIASSGYESLSAKEKEILFRQSGK